MPFLFFVFSKGDRRSKFIFVGLKVIIKRIFHIQALKGVKKRRRDKKCRYNEVWDEGDEGEKKT